MVNNVYAIMFDMGPALPDDPKARLPRRFELDVFSTPQSLTELLETYTGPYQQNPDESVLRVGYKTLPADTSVHEFLDEMNKLYGGNYGAGPPYRGKIYFIGQKRQNARQLLIEQEFQLD